MVELDRITTGTGDQGITALGNGEWVAKASLRVNAYGSVDELNSLLGVVAAEALPEQVAAEIDRIQNDLFNLGADLAAPPRDGKPLKVPRIGPWHIARLEQALTQANGQLEPARSAGWQSGRGWPAPGPCRGAPRRA